MLLHQCNVAQGGFVPFNLVLLTADLFPLNFKCGNIMPLVKLIALCRRVSQENPASHRSLLRAAAVNHWRLLSVKCLIVETWPKTAPSQRVGPRMIVLPDQLMVAIFLIPVQYRNCQMRI